MSSTAAGPDPFPFRQSEAQAYFQAVEATFIALRGAPLLLAPDDWQVARRWHGDGIPLRLVQQTLAEVFEKRRKKEGEDGKRKLVTLRYCRRAVERAWRQRRELVAPATVGEAPAFDVAARLDALAASLPADWPEREGLASRLRELEGEAEEVEERLVALDREALERAAEQLDGDRRKDLAEHVEASLRPLRARLPAAACERAERLLREQVVRRMTGLPVLSLFSPEAEG